MPDGSACTPPQQNRQKQKQNKASKHLDIRKVQEKDVKEEKEREETEKVRCFLTYIEWQQEQRVQGGITWLEMYILYTLHGGKVTANPMAKTLSLQTAIKQFKTRARKVAQHCIAKEDEWQLQPCEARKNRMEALAICNKHAGIKGMPRLNDQEAKRVTAAVLAMRGVNQKKQKLAHQEGNLKLHRRPMAYKGLSRAWLRNLTKASHQDDWTVRSKTPDKPESAKIPLKRIGCPKCSFMQDTAKHRLRAKIGYGQMTCQRCRHATKSSTWTCECSVEWHKCHMHVHANYLGKVSPWGKASKRGIDVFSRGTNEPLPKQRRVEENAIAISDTSLPNIRMELRPGTVMHRLFADKFPHLVKTNLPTEGH